MSENSFEYAVAQVRNGRDLHLETVRENFPEFIPYTEAIIALAKEEDRLAHAKKDLRNRHIVLEAIDPKIYPDAVEKAKEDIPNLETEIRGYESLVKLARAEFEEEKSKITPEKLEIFERSLEEKKAEKMTASGLYPPKDPALN